MSPIRGNSHDATGLSEVPFFQLPKLAAVIIPLVSSSSFFKHTFIYTYNKYISLALLNSKRSVRTQLKGQTLSNIEPALIYPFSKSNSPLQANIYPRNILTSNPSEHINALTKRHIQEFYWREKTNNFVTCV